jgi:hypothetical protein
VHVRLTRKLAEALNGLDLRPFRIGEVIDLPVPLAQMLIAERWAEEAVAVDCPATAEDRAPRPKKADAPSASGSRSGPTRARSRPRGRSTP